MCYFVVASFPELEGLGTSSGSIWRGVQLRVAELELNQQGKCSEKTGRYICTMGVENV